LLIAEDAVVLGRDRISFNRETFCGALAPVGAPASYVQFPENRQAFDALLYRRHHRALIRAGLGATGW